MSKEWIYKYLWFLNRINKYDWYDLWMFAWQLKNEEYKKLSSSIYQLYNKYNMMGIKIIGGC